MEVKDRQYHAPKPDLKIGDDLAVGVWLQADADLEKERDMMRASFDAQALGEGAILGNHEFLLISPDHDHAPEAPPGAVAYLVMRTKITGHTLTPIRGRFCDELDEKDLDRLIKILRRVYPYYNPGKPLPSREKCMEWIDENGPEVALEALREQVGVKIQ